MRPVSPQTGTNAPRSRSRNRQAVLGQIHRAGTMGRAEIARELSLSTQAVSNIIADLEGDGMLLEKGRLAQGRGQPAVQYALNPEGGFALGFEVRPDAVFAAVLDMEGRSVATRREALTASDPETVLRCVRDLRDDVLGDAPKAGARLLGAGLVMPGPFGATGIAGQGSELTGWGEVDVVRHFSDALGLTVEVSNDANAAAMAERISGVAQGLDHYAYLYFGAGLGLGIVSDGHLLHGAFGNAGEIGHVPLPSGASLESTLSRLSVQRHLAARGTAAGDIEALNRLYSGGNGDLSDWLAAATEALSHALSTIENMLDPQTVILGGAMPAALLDHLVDHTRPPALSIANRPDRTLPRLMRGTAGRMTATLGAAALVLNRTLTPQTLHAH